MRCEVFVLQDFGCVDVKWGMEKVKQSKMVRFVSWSGGLRARYSSNHVLVCCPWQGHGVAIVRERSPYAASIDAGVGAAPSSGAAGDEM